MEKYTNMVHIISVSQKRLVLNLALSCFHKNENRQYNINLSYYIAHQRNLV